MSCPFCAGARKENYMATIMIGSARINERGKLSGGVAGDQKQVSSANDTKGEVSMQPFYVQRLVHPATEECSSGRKDG